MVVPNDACIGTNAPLQATVAPLQHNSTKKLKNPKTNCEYKISAGKHRSVTAGQRTSDHRRFGINIKVNMER
ncbi:hypothetical protein V9T40_009600 [Parthenolecanium corni]|uniref:Uncharacterized protein n=1 Tax=Parthenolecanium corni TaxID=536013 RepID=A0AAN9TZL8_9HEMI